MEDDTVPRERHECVAGRRGGGRGQVEGGFEEGGVDSVSVDIGAFGEGDLAEQLPFPHPDRCQALEQRPVPIAVIGEPLIEIVQRHPTCSRRRPCLERRRLRPSDTGGGSEEALGVALPLLRSDQARTHRHRPTPSGVGVGIGNVHLNLDDTGRRDQQGGVDDELIQHRTIHPIPSGDGKLDDRGAGNDHGVGDRVLGQPRMGVQRHPPGQHHPTRNLDRRTQQRMPTGHLTGTGSSRSEPITIPLERVRGQRNDPTGNGGTGNQRGQSSLRDRPAHSPQLQQPGDDRIRLRLIPTRQRHRRNRMVTGPGERGQTSIRTDLDQEVAPGFGEGLGIRDGFTDLPHPVLRRRPLPSSGRRRLPIGDTRSDSGELLQHRIHQR